MKQKVRYTNEEKKEMALKYLKDKYDEEFEGIAYTPEQLLQGHDEFYVYPKNGTREDAFQVWGAIQQDGTYKMKDGYFGIIIHDEYQKIVEGIVGDFYSDFKLKIDTMRNVVFADRLNKSTRIDEIYNKEEAFSPDILVYVKQSPAIGINTEEALSKIAEGMVKNKLTATISLFVVTDDTYDSVPFDSYLTMSLDEMVKNRVEKKSLFIKRDFSIKKYWEEN